MDLMIREFQETIINYINSVDLPPTVKRMALEEIMSELHRASEAAIRKQLDEKGESKDELQ